MYKSTLFHRCYCVFYARNGGSTHSKPLTLPTNMKARARAHTRTHTEKRGVIFARKTIRLVPEKNKQNNLLVRVIEFGFCLIIWMDGHTIWTLPSDADQPCPFLFLFLVHNRGTASTAPTTWPSRSEATFISRTPRTAFLRKKRTRVSPLATASEACTESGRRRSRPR